MKTLPLFLVVLVSTLSFAAEETSPASPAPKWIGPVWALAELDGKGVAVESTPTIQLKVEKSQVTGSTGVNRFFGTYELKDTALSFGELGMTRRAGPPDAMDLESRFALMLAKVSAWRMVDEKLELLAGDKLVARFTAAPNKPEAH